jgi:hypothetical protein
VVCGTRRLVRSRCLSTHESEGCLKKEEKNEWIGILFLRRNALYCFIKSQIEWRIVYLNWGWEWEMLKESRCWGEATSVNSNPPFVISNVCRGGWCDESVEGVVLIETELFAVTEWLRSNFCLFQKKCTWWMNESMNESMNQWTEWETLLIYNHTMIWFKRFWNSYFFCLPAIALVFD